MDTPKLRKELDALLTRDRRAPADLRRIAELTEILYSDAAALYWWHLASAAGDQDAIDYLEVLDQEQQAAVPPMQARQTCRTITERVIFFVCAVVGLKLRRHWHQ
jgi:hypothetical protein